MDIIHESVRELCEEGRFEVPLKVVGDIEEAAQLSEKARDLVGKLIDSIGEHTRQYEKGLLSAKGELERVGEMLWRIRQDVWPSK